MTTDRSFYRWAKFKNGIGSVAMVTLDVCPNISNQNKIVENYSGRGFSGQGQIEEIPAKGYDSWKAAARNGLEFDFSLINGYWTVNLIKIEGRSFTDTNPTIAGYTVIRAFFDKINFELESKQIEIIEEFVLAVGQNRIRNLFPTSLA